MKKILLAATAVAVLCSFAAQAETVQGKVKEVKGNTIVMQMQDGSLKTFKASDNTNYKTKKVMKKDKKKHGRQMKKGDTYFQPMVEEDDWIELTYTPATQNLNEAEIEQVVVYDD